MDTKVAVTIIGMTVGIYGTLFCFRLVIADIMKTQAEHTARLDALEKKVL